MSVRHIGSIKDVDQFDALFFGIAPREAARMDPQQRLLLEVAWEALEVAGLSPEAMSGQSTGVFVGIGAADYAKVFMHYENYYRCIDAHVGTGNALSIAANRVSYVLDLRGPSIAVDTACSSSTVAIHSAIQSLRNRECNAAIAGGVNLILTPETTIAFSKAHMLSTDGHCRPFDSGANGYVRGEGCGLLVLKRLTDATRDRDNILGIIRASAVNQDGRTSGITAPNARSQQAVIRAALAQARWMPDRVEYIEAHGTGTPLGDPIEMESLTRIFRRNHADDAPCYVSSVKANIGHTETVSGVAGIIKVLLMMQHGQIPAQLHFQQLNSHISLEGTRLEIPSSNREWHRNGTPRTAGVSSFGFGGTNTHILLEESVAAPMPIVERDRPQHLLTLSAKTETALDAILQSYGTYLSDHPKVQLADICHTANVGRSHFNHRLAVTAVDTAEMRDKLAQLTEGKKPTGTWRRQTKAAASPKVAFVFTGQGSQYVQMGRELYDTQPTFRRTLEQCEDILRPWLERPLLSVLFPKDGEASPLDETAYTQPALFALEYSLAKLWMSWGIQPALVLGHSVGEYVAACIAGVFSLEHGLQLIAQRARLMQQLPRDGMMAVVFAPSARVEAALATCSDRVAIAAFNGPDNTVISGDIDTVRDLLDAFALEGIRTQALTVSHAFHSPLMDPMLDEFEAFAATLDYAAPKIPLVSNLTGTLMGKEPPSADYWRRHVRNPVRFAEGIELLKSHEIAAVLEVGPTSSLLGMARRCLPEFKAAWLPSLRKGQDDWSSMLASLAEMYMLGTKVSWSGFDAEWPRRRMILPTYPFQRSRHWLDPTTPERSLTSGSSGPSLHPLLGHHVPTALDSELFENRISSHWPTYLVDHQVQGSPVLPAAAYVEQALAAAAQAFGPGNHHLLDVEFQQAMFLPQRVSRTVQLSVAPEQSSARPFETFSVAVDADPSTKWTLHAAGRLQHANVSNGKRPQPIDLDSIRNRTSDCTAQQHFYDEMRERTLDYGPNFQMLDSLARLDGEAIAEVHLPESIKREMSQYHIHPVLGDALFQSMAGLVPRESDGSLSSYTYMPVAVRRVQFFATLTETMLVHAVRTSKVEQASPETVEGDVSLVDEQGQVLVQFLGVRVQRVARASQGSSSTDVRDWLYRVSWRPAALEATTTVPSRWLIFCDDSGIGAELAEQARRQGGEALLVRPGETFGKLPVHNGDVPGYVIDPANEDHYRSLLEQAIGSSPDAVIAHLWSLDLDDPSESPEQSLADSRALGCHSVLHLVRQLARRNTGRPPRLALVTRGAQSIDETTAEIAVAQSPLWGLGRVVAMENPELRSRLIDLDPKQDAVVAASQLWQELAAVNHEEQIAFRNDSRLIARLEAAPHALPTEESTNGGDNETSVPTGRPFRLRFNKAGSFDTLRYEAMQRGTPAEGQVELAVHAAGINFSDILKVMGLYPGITDPVVPLGIEAAGIVTAVGPGVTRFRVGDEVLGVVPFSLASHARTAEYALVPMPRNINFRQAATIPITFLTAHYALCKLAQLDRGERVLIHAAAGGVGLAAIQIAQHLGAEVFATAGSDEKRDVLRRLGVKHVFSSRSLDFAEQIMEVTGREGVDVVLNSLPGEAIASSLGVLRAYGRFLEIGKTDIYQNRKIGLLPFQDNLSYFAIDLDRLLRQRPATVTSLFAEVMQLFENGVYQPLPLTEFPARNVAGAFRYMAQRKNIGKVVVSIDAVTGSDEDASSPSQGHASSGTYLITGGLVRWDCKSPKDWQPTACGISHCFRAASQLTRARRSSRRLSPPV